MESNKKKFFFNIIWKKVIRQISGRSHYVCRKPVGSTGKVFAAFFSIINTILQQLI